MSYTLHSEKVAIFVNWKSICAQFKIKEKKNIRAIVIAKPMVIHTQVLQLCIYLGLSMAMLSFHDLYQMNGIFCVKKIIIVPSDTTLKY